ncbi:MAG: glutathione S-transferase N-terminal domain-containing protein [Pseudomonadota bacterium]
MKFYFHRTPNPMKVALALEEFGLDYEVVPVDTFKGEQHTPDFRAINPNGKLPALQDGDEIVFDSNAILLYLALKHNRFYDPASMAATLSWLMSVATGLSPYNGQMVHFTKMAPEDLPYAKNRYTFEAKRHHQILDDRLAQSAYLAGSTYSVVDMAAWGWLSYAPVYFGEAGLSEYPNVKRLFDEISARPAAARALKLKETHPTSTDFNEEAKRAMFPSNYAAT